MEIREGGGGCYWLLMVAFFILGAATFPFGIAIWAIQALIILNTKRG